MRVIAGYQRLCQMATWHTLWLAVQSTAPTFTRPFMLVASLFHTGLSCWQCPHLHCTLSAHQGILQRSGHAAVEARQHVCPPAFVRQGHSLCSHRVLYQAHKASVQGLGTAAHVSGLCLKRRHVIHQQAAAQAWARPRTREHKIQSARAPLTS